MWRFARKDEPQIQIQDEIVIYRDELEPPSVRIGRRDPIHLVIGEI